MIERYRPLPKELRLGFSKIHDIGLFAKEKIKRGRNLGISHIQIGKELFRTPLGGFINHSNTPNVVKVELRTNGQDPSCVTKKWSLVTLKDIKKGEELTIRYTFYNI